MLCQVRFNDGLPHHWTSLPRLMPTEACREASDKWKVPWHVPRLVQCEGYRTALRRLQAVIQGLHLQSLGADYSMRIGNCQMGVIRYWGWSLNLGDFAGSFPLDQPVDEVLGLYQVGLEAKRFCGEAWPRRWSNFGPGSPARLGLAALTKTAG